MREPLIEIDMKKAKSYYSELKLNISFIEDQYNKIMSKAFTESNWSKEGEKIASNILNLESNKKKLELFLKSNSNNKDKNIKLFKDVIENVEKYINPLIAKIKTKTKNYKPNYFTQININTTNNNVEYFDFYEEKKRLEDIERQKIMQSYNIIKDTQMQMMNNIIKQQNEMLEEIEKGVIDSNENVENSSKINVEEKKIKQVENKEEEGPSIIENLKIFCSKYTVIISASTFFFILGLLIGLIIGLLI